MPKTFDDSGDFASHFLDIRMATKALRAFEKGINSPEEFKETFFMDINKPSIQIGTITGGQNQIGGSNNTIMNTTAITADIIREKLKENGAPEQLIVAIDTEVAKIAAECDKKTPDKGKLQFVLSKIKESGGKFLYDIVTLTISQILASKISG
jgi:hypothetical protein